MVVNAVCFIAGICFLVNIDVLPGGTTLFLISVVVVVLARRVPPILFLALGFVTAALHASHTLSGGLPDQFFHKEVVVTGRVSGLAQINESRVRFILRAETVSDIESNASHHAKGAKIRLNWYGLVPPLKPSDTLVLRVKLKPPNGFMNPGGFDYEKWLFQQRIVATGYVRNKSLSGITLNDTNPSFSVSTQFELARSWLHRRLLDATEGLRNGGLILALAVGDRSGIDRIQWERFLATGTNHLLAISGLHITLVAGFAAFIAKMLWAWFKPLQHISRNNFSLLAAAFAAFAYASMAGFSLPTQRALIMFGVLVVLAMLRRHQQRQSALATALIVVCLLNPLAVMSAGFWMSFAAVAILFLVFSFVQNNHWRGRLSSIIRGHILITVGLYPVTLLIFEKASLVSPLANFIAVPVVGMLVTPVVFVASLVAILSVKAASFVFIPVDWVLSAVDWLFGLMARLPLAMIYFGELSVGSLLLIMCAAALLLLPLRAGIRWIAIVLAFPIVFSRSDVPDYGDYRLTFLDVGQGTAVVIQTQQHTLVYDTGPQFSSSFNAADAVIIPFLRSQRIRSIDGLMVSHGDRDHSGGADELVDAIDVQVAMASAPLPELPGAYDCRGGQQWVWDNVSFQVLHPAEFSTGSENDLSCVLLVSTAGGKHSLLPGDIEQAGEAGLLEQQLPLIDVLMAPHHGSNTSSGPAFVAATLPEHVVYTTGFANRYRFPKQAVRERYQLVGSSEYSTAASGAITFDVSDRRAVSVLEYRKMASGFWGRHRHPFSREAATL